MRQVDHVDAVVDAKPVKVLYKDAEGINTFCINKVQTTLLVASCSTQKVNS